MKKKEKNFVVLIGAVALIGIGAGGTYLANFKKIEFMNRYPEFLEMDKFVTETLEIDVPNPEDEKSVISAYLSLYGDKYTRIDEALSWETKEFAVENVNNSSVAKTSGFRIQFNENEQPYFSFVMEDKEAYKQGIRVGDIIKNIDDFELTEYKHVIRIDGENGETAKLIIERDGEELALEFIRNANEAEQKGIDSQLYEETLYIALDNIDSEITEAFKQEVSDKKFENLIIDLRNNPGGRIEAAVDLADLFIDEAQVKCYAQNGSVSVVETHKGIEYDVQITVLINEKTVSAAEILTGLLKQYGNATLVGMNTVGKSIYQNGALYKKQNIRYTEGYVTVGDWECYQGKGIKPDIEIDMDSDYIGTEYDIQLEKALELAK